MEENTIFNIMKHHFKSAKTSEPQTDREDNSPPDLSCFDIDLNSRMETLRCGPNMLSTYIGLEGPPLLGERKILDINLSIFINFYLAERLQFRPWNLLYSVLRDGSHFTSFYSKVRGYKHSVLIVETESGEKFGGFASCEWRSLNAFFGCGECFIFKFNDEKQFQHFGWSGSNNFYMFSSATQIAMGGGGAGFGFVLDENFERGGSSHCETFNNEPLASTDMFRVVNVECWGLMKP